MKKVATESTAESKKAWKTPKMEKFDVAKSTQGKPNVSAGEAALYAPS